MRSGRVGATVVGLVAWRDVEVGLGDLVPPGLEFAGWKPAPGRPLSDAIW